MSAPRSFVDVSYIKFEQSQLGDFSLAGAFDYFDPLAGILPKCETNRFANNTLIQLGNIVRDARKILKNRNSKQINAHAEQIQSHISQHSPYFLRYMHFNNLLDECSPAKALNFCIEDFIEKRTTNKFEAWSKPECFSILALSLIANMYANFWKSINQPGIKADNTWNLQHYEWFTLFEHLPKEAIDYASQELVTEQNSNEHLLNSDDRVVRPDHIISRYLDFMQAAFEKSRSENKRFVFKVATNDCIKNELNDEEIYMMGSDNCLDCLLKHWRDYRKSNSNWKKI